MPRKAAAKVSKKKAKDETVAEAEAEEEATPVAKKPPKRAPRKKAAAKVVDEENEEEAEEEVKPMEKAEEEVKPMEKEEPKKGRNKRKRGEPEEQEEKEDGGDNDEEEDEEPAKKKRKKSATAEKKEKPAKEKKEKPAKEKKEKKEKAAKEPKGKKGPSKTVLERAAMRNTGCALITPPSVVPGEMIKIVSWNVNSLKACMKDNRFHDYVQAENPDIICLQETKVSGDNAPVDALPGYVGYFNTGTDRAGRDGTGMYTKIGPVKIETLLGMKEFDGEGRYMCAEFENFFLVNTYVPNVGDKLQRLEERTGGAGWDVCLKAKLEELGQVKPVVWCGDLNVAHEEIDVANPKNKAKQPGFTKQERDNFGKLLGAGFVDTFRQFNPGVEQYSFFSYRVQEARNKNIGWRLDYFVVSAPLMPRVGASIIREKDIAGSDHLPIVLLLAKA